MTAGDITIFYNGDNKWVIVGQFGLDLADLSVFSPERSKTLLEHFKSSSFSLGDVISTEESGGTRKTGSDAKRVCFFTLRNSSSCSSMLSCFQSKN